MVVLECKIIVLYSLTKFQKESFAHARKLQRGVVWT